MWTGTECEPAVHQRRSTKNVTSRPGEVIITLYTCRKATSEVLQSRKI